MRAQSPSLRPSGHVNDFANILDATSRAELESLLATLETETTAEVAVVTVTSLDGTSVEEFANTLFRTWGIGQRDKDNGVLILVAPAERRMRIEVGYGLEPVLPDGLAGQVTREEFLPAFETLDFTKGILQGTRRVAMIVRANEAAASEAPLSAAALVQHKVEAPEWLLGTIVGLFVAVASFETGVGLSARAIFPIVKGLVLAGILISLQWLLLGPFAVMVTGAVIHLPAAAVAGIWGIPQGPHAGVAEHDAKEKGRTVMGVGN